MPPGTLLQMSLKDGAGLHVFQTEFTQEQLGKASVFLNIVFVINCIFLKVKISEIFYSSLKLT